MKISIFSGLQVLRHIGSVAFVVLLIFGAGVNAMSQDTGATPVAGSKTDEKVSKDPTQDQSKIKVVFDEDQPGIVIIESNGEKIRVDTSKKTVEQVAANESKNMQPNTQQQDAKVAAVKEEKEEARMILTAAKSLSITAWSTSRRLRAFQKARGI